MLNREQIIKALECCGSFNDELECGKRCYLHGDAFCEWTLKKDAYSLIKELSEENERLRAENDALVVSEVKDCEFSQEFVYRIRDKHPVVLAIKADTVHRMHDMIKERCIEGGIYPAFVARIVDEVEKELIGDEA